MQSVYKNASRPGVHVQVSSILTWSNCLVHAADVQCFKMETFTHEDSRNEIFSKAPEGSDTDVEVDVEAKGSL